MMKSAEPWARDHDGRRRRPVFYRVAIRRVLVERIVNTVLLMVGDVFMNEPAQMTFIQRDDMIEDLTTGTPHPAFRHSVLPGHPDACALGFQARALQKCGDVVVEL
jgi:hypothetical protein